MSLFPAAATRQMRATMAASFNATLTVYAPAADGTFSAVVANAIPCRLARLGLANAVTAADRADLAAWRLLYWDTAYALPEDTVQLAIAGERWNPVAGTYEAMDVGEGEIVYRRAQVVRGDDG